MINIFFFTGCDRATKSETDKKPIKIAVNPWVGYTPLMYLNEKGTLKKLGFELVFVSSLGENANLLSNHLVDGFAATQYEYINYKDELDGIVPLFTIDRSDGADKIHANVSIDTLRKTDRPIDVYFEFGSVNEDIFNTFIQTYHLEKKKFKFHHDPQSVVASLNLKKGQIVIVVSYEPYSSILESRGIKEVASSHNLDILIIDALFSSVEKATKARHRFIELKKAFWEAQALLKRDPKPFYQVIRNYLENQSYEDFLKSLEGIQWLKEPDEKIRQRLKQQGIDTAYLL
jgi:NitT/TauT family transport system substrate-binding protein